MVLSEIIIAVTVAYLGPKRSYRLILKGERYVLRKSWLRDWLCQKRRENNITRPAPCNFPQCQCFPHWFIRRVFHGVFSLASRLRLSRPAPELSGERRPERNSIRTRQLPRRDSREHPSDGTND
ncbi:hypothetical protein CCYA_CCYA06G1757 [Cyanidiococcus yangmingshanensis]|nr:hypothetical protein CCYA_CCYA06G1757 [Cyanidiococcus yangmingshanensis]